MEEFLNSPDVRVITYFGDNLTSVHGLPKKIARGTSRVVYFMKMKAAPVSADTVAEDVVVSDMTPEPLEHLEKVLSEVYIPLLSNPNNQEGWGEVASKEIMDRLHGFLANVSITVGQTRGETCLPLPPLDASTAAHISSKDRIHLLEGAVITWTKQIKVRACVACVNAPRCVKSVCARTHPTPPPLAFLLRVPAECVETRPRVAAEGGLAPDAGRGD
ncbi:hypothetical protein EON62_00430 [archaeon]|nr:MAG: hypothetical protein EON62_00430 [archaeon]